MKQTWKEAHISKCIRRGNRYKWSKPLMLLEIISIICIERTVNYLNDNKKRIIGTGATVLVFLVSNSFSAPAFGSRQMLESAIAEPQQVQLADSSLESIPNGEEEILLTQGLEHDYSSDDQYSVDEILSNSSSQELLKQQAEIDPGDGFSKDDWNLILVNKQHPVPEGYTFELGTIAADMKCDVRILPELFAMLQAARNNGVNLMVCSPYRDISLQNVLFTRKITHYMGQGNTYMEAYKKASQIVTVPGASEHQVGLALDIICDTYTVLDEGFGETAAGKWLKEHSKEYGFILRYPKGKEHITGIGYEPWHFRYVGKEAATIIMDNSLTLEEFVESISE